MNKQSWSMEVPLRATLPLLGVGVLTLLLSLIFCCYLYWLRRQGRAELGYKQRRPLTAVMVKYRKMKNKTNEVCPVCLDEFESGEKLAMCPCKHVFHCKCLLQWLNNSNTCPLCKRGVRREPGENTRLFLSDEDV